MRELLASRPYRLLFLAGFLSELGTYISEVAILMHIFELAGRQKEFLGITQGVFLLLMVLGTLVGGVFGEGRAKKQILMGCEFARIPILASMLAFSSSVWVLILGNGLIAFFSGAFNPTRQALMNELLPTHLLPKANSLFATGFAFLHAAGPILGAVFFAYAQNLIPILQFDLLTYCVGIVLLARLSPPPPHPQQVGLSPAPGFLKDLGEGLGLLRKRPTFLWIFARCALASTALGIVIPLLLPMATEVLLLPDWAYGLLLGCFGIGGAFGSLILPKRLAVFSPERVLLRLVAFEALSLLLWSACFHPALSFLMAFVYGALLFARIAFQLNYVSLQLPHAFNARANALIDLAMVVPNIAGAALVAFAGRGLDTTRFLNATGLFFCGSVLLCWILEQRLRRIE
ncbi:MAG: MFS family permease [Verrucomicrobia bacterium]|nr:MAG: MFS family permease [Verrucomicrobiota bacterium]